MNQLKKAASLVAVTALLLSLLAACQGGSKVDPVQEALGYSKDTVFATFNGQKITAEDYLFWLARYADYINQMQTMMGAPSINWEEDMGGGVSAKDYMKSETLETVKLFWVIENMAKEKGVKLGAEDKKAFDEERTAAIEQTGGQEAYEVYLKSMCLTDESMERINNVSALANKLEKSLCREGGQFDATKDTVRSFMEEQGILKAKHILLLTKDPVVDGKAYSQEKIAQQKKLADDLLAQLRASEEPLVLFDKLMNEYSEDTGLQGNPGGYLFSTSPDGVDFTSRMVPQFEEGTKALGFNEISDVVESEYGYHIILRLDPVEDQETFEKYQTKWWGSQMDKLYQEKVDAVKVETTEAYNNLNVQEFYEKLQAYRESLQAAIQPEGEGQEDANKEEGDAGEAGSDADQSKAPADGSVTGDDATKSPEGETQPTGQQNPAEGGETPAQ